MHMGSLIQVFWERCVGKSQIGLSLSSLRRSRTCAESGPDPDRLENHLFAFAREVLGSRPLACSTIGCRQGVAGRRLPQRPDLHRRARTGHQVSKFPTGKSSAISSGGKPSASTSRALQRLCSKSGKPSFGRRLNVLHRLVANELSTWNWGSRSLPGILVLLCTV